MYKSFFSGNILIIKKYKGGKDNERMDKKRDSIGYSSGIAGRSLAVQAAAYDRRDCRENYPLPCAGKQ